MKSFELKGENRMETTEVKKTRKTIKIVIELVVLLIMFVLFGLYGINQLMSVIVHSRREVTVPNLTGKSIEEALDILSKDNIHLMKEGEQYSNKMPPGYIIFQIPSAGNTMRENRAVKVIISQGGEVVFIPEVINQNVRRAEIILRQAGLSLGEQTRAYSVRIPRDVIISQDPPSNNTVEKGTMVNLVVSDGPSPNGVLLMPDLVGKNVRQAIEILKQWDLNIVGINKKEDDKLPGDTVIAQTPLPETLIEENNKEVTLTVSVKKGTSLSSGQQETKFIYYEVSQGMFDKHIRMILVDNSGEKVVYD